jgi:hypothetical protein
MGSFLLVDTKVVLVIIVFYYEFGVKMQTFGTVLEFHEGGAS